MIHRHRLKSTPRIARNPRGVLCLEEPSNSLDGGKKGRHHTSASVKIDASHSAKPQRGFVFGRAVQFIGWRTFKA